MTARRSNHCRTERARGQGPGRVANFTKKGRSEGSKIGPTCPTPAGPVSMVRAAASPQEQLDLAERIRKADPAAEELLVRLYGAPVYAMLLARTGDREAARDLMQEVLMAVVLALRNGHVREASRLAAFVHGTARNLANNYLRSIRQHPNAPPLDARELAATAAISAEDQERRAFVREALGHLGATDRTILLLTLVENLKPGEIAEQLDLNPDVVRARKSRAVKKVAEYLKKASQK